MPSVAFDTLEFVEHLKEAGVPEKQAKAIAEAQKQAFFQVLDTSLATKADVFSVKSELRTDLVALKSEMRSDPYGGSDRIGG